MSSSANTPQSARPNGTPRVWRAPLAITSGKGGVGKTFVRANLAAALTRQGASRCWCWTPTSAWPIWMWCSTSIPKITLHDVFTGKNTPGRGHHQSARGFSVLLAGSGLVEYSRLTPEVRDQLRPIDQAVTAF